jgi:hypothetical protein
VSELGEYRRSKADAPVEVLVRSGDWQPLIRFMAGWFRTPICAATGVSPAELNELERRFGRKMPTSLREWYRLLGAHEAVRDETGQDFEMPPSRVGESARWLVIFGENQECWHCGVLNEHWDLPDPPVYFESFSFDPVRDAGYNPASLVDGRFIRVTETLTEFVFGMALRQMVIRLDPSPFMNPGVSGATFGRGYNPSPVRVHFKLQPLLDFPAGLNPEFDGADIVLVEDWGFAARTQAVFETVSRVVRESGGTLPSMWRAK